MNLEFRVTGTSKAATKASILLAKSQQGTTIRKTEWPAWTKARKLKLSHDELHTGGLHAYLKAMDLDESEADPRAISWGAYGEWCANDPRDGRCNVCSKGTMDGAVCDSCAEWSEAIVDTWSRTRQEAMLKAHLDAELAA